MMKLSYIFLHNIFNSLKANCPFLYLRDFNQSLVFNHRMNAKRTIYQTTPLDL